MRMKGLVVLWASCAVACARPEAPARPDAAVAQVQASPVDAYGQALGHDPEPIDEGLRVALHDLRDRFLCNSISGCKSEQVLIDYGWTVRPYLEQVFTTASAQASYRARTVRIIAQLRDPAALPFLVQVLPDRDPEVRAYAIFGLGLLDAQQLRGRVAAIAREDIVPWTAPARLSALWTLHLWRDPGAGEAFLAALRVLSGQHTGALGLTWGAELCMRDGAPDCRTVLPLIARHPGFSARRQAARAMAARPEPGQEAALVELTADPVHSIGELAEGALRRLTGTSLVGAEAWRSWCRQTQCQDKTP